MKTDPWAAPPTAQELGQKAAPESPRRKMARALDILLPGVPESSEQAIGMGMGMSMPNPLPFVGQALKGTAKAIIEGVRGAAGSMFPRAMEAGGAALDPVLQQAPRKTLPAIPALLEHLPGVGGPSRVYNILRGLSESAPREMPASPYPAGAPAAAPAAPPAAPTQSVLPQAPPAAAPAPAPASAVNIFEKAARSDKVAQLVKAIDANAGMHIGVDMRDPRAAEALASLPQQWWDGMAQASGVNKPSQETINQALEFFRDRAAQGAGPQMAAGQ